MVNKFTHNKFQIQPTATHNVFLWLNCCKLSSRRNSCFLCGLCNLILQFLQLCLCVSHQNNDTQEKWQTYKKSWSYSTWQTDSTKTSHVCLSKNFSPELYSVQCLSHKLVDIAETSNWQHPACVCTFSALQSWHMQPTFPVWLLISFLLQYWSQIVGIECSIPSLEVRWSIKGGWGFSTAEYQDTSGWATRRASSL